MRCRSRPLPLSMRVSACSRAARLLLLPWVAAFRGMMRESDMHRGRRHLLTLAVAVELCAASAWADDPAQQAHAIMREALLERAAPTAGALVGSSGAPHSAATIAREHMDRMRRAEAERAAHRRAVEHGTRRSGAGRPDRQMNGAPGNMHGGSNSGSWGMDCQDAAGNWRTKDMHGDWMPGGGGMPMGLSTGGSSSTAQRGAAKAPEQAPSR